MKKSLFTLLILVSVVICMGLAVLSGGSAYAMELTDDECDVVFWENISELYEGNRDSLTVTATKEIVYDVDLNRLGFVYDFYANGEEGYAVVIGTDGRFEATEFFFDAENPYADIPQGSKPIYVSSMLYLFYDSGVYYLADGHYVVDEEVLDSMRNVAFYGDDTIYGNYTEYVYFTNRTETNYEMAKRHPGLVAGNDLPVSCAPVAGGNLIQFWDRYKTDLIPNYTPGTIVGSFYLYKESSSTTNSLITQLYSDMGTGANGTMIAQFKTGLGTYCSRQGYTATFTSCMSGGAFNYSVAKQQISAGKPVVLFVDTYTINDFTQRDGYDYITYKVGSGTHVMAGFGYKEVTYALTSGGTRQDYYLAIASGSRIRQRGFFNVNYNTQIDDAYSLLVS